MREFLFTSAVLALFGASTAATPVLAADAAATDDSSAAAATGSGKCPVTWQNLRNALVAAKSTPGGFKNDMWGVVVNRDGAVCAVAFSGNARTDQWLLSRQIAAAKAFTANGLSLNIGKGSQQLSTLQLDPLVQPTDDGGTLFGVHFGNPLDATQAYKGPTSRWGTASDPLVGKIVGGTITFGGGVALVKGGQVLGALGVSGDTACRDDAFARAARAKLGLDQSAGDGSACKP